MAERPLFDHDAERALLGAMMLSADAIRAGANLTTADFHDGKHAAIFDAILRTHAQGGGVDPVTVAAALNGQLEKVGGKQGLIKIQVETPASANAEGYARIVGDLARNRRAQVKTAEINDAILKGQPWEHMLPDLSSEQVTSTSRLISGADFMAQQTEDFPTVWGTGEEVLWASGQSLLIVAPTGVGKSTVALQLVAARLGLQEEVLGFRVEPSRSKILYLAMDRPAQIRGLFRRRFTDEDDQLAVERDVVVWEGPLEHDLAQRPDLLLRLAEQAGADTVVVDSLKDTTADLSSDEAGSGLNRAMQLCVAANVEVLALHHQRKGQGGAQPKTISDIHGNSGIPNGAGSVVLLWGEAGDPLVELHHLKQPVMPIGPLQVTHDHATGVSSVTRGPTDPLKLMNRPGGITAWDLAKADREGGDPTKVQVAKARRKLDGLVRRGLVRRIPSVEDGKDAYVAALPSTSSASM